MYPLYHTTHTIYTDEDFPVCIFLAMRWVPLVVRRATERNCEMIKMVEYGDATHGRQIFRDKRCVVEDTGLAWT